MRSLEESVVVSEFRRGRHAHAADRSSGEIRHDVAEHVLHHYDIIMLRTLEKVNCHCVRIRVIGLDVRVLFSHLVEDLSEKSVCAEHICLVADRHALLAIAGSTVTLASKLEGCPADTFSALPGDHQRIYGHLIPQVHAVA